jgi:hypothetical protein
MKYWEYKLVNDKEIWNSVNDESWDSYVERSQEESMEKWGNPGGIYIYLG